MTINKLVLVRSNQPIPVQPIHSPLNADECINTIIDAIRPSLNPDGVAYVALTDCEGSCCGECPYANEIKKYASIKERNNFIYNNPQATSIAIPDVECRCQKHCHTLLNHLLFHKPLTDEVLEYAKNYPYHIPECINEKVKKLYVVTLDNVAEVTGDEAKKRFYNFDMLYGTSYDREFFTHADSVVNFRTDSYKENHNSFNKWWMTIQENLYELNDLDDVFDVAL